MSSAESTGVAAARGGLRVRMLARDTDEKGRASTSLELLFDLTFVVAIASITAQLAHGIVSGHAAETLVPFLEVFFAIWWAWMNFTWFASSFDTDDVPYRLLTMLQMAGVLVLAAGVPAAFNDANFTGVTLGYLIMRIGLVAQWVRAARDDAQSRRTASRYAVGIVIVEAGWLLRLTLADGGVLPTAWLSPVFLLLVVAELSVPLWAERTGHTRWHPHHIAERYGLFTIILLGESVLAASTGLQGALNGGGVSGSLIVVAVAGLMLLFSFWWLYFLEPSGSGLAARPNRSYLWGYGHYGIFAALAALGAGLEVAVSAAEHSEVSVTIVAYAVAFPAGAFLVLLWAVHAPIVARPVIRPAVILVAAAVTLVLPLGAELVGLVAVVCCIAFVSAFVVTITLALGRLRAAASQAAPASLTL
ncbi:low temperature requirement protein A [Subtercola endophyticus]|uniref:low temperature requirement protein A n=1 Tax=Subtercola endophyticus TaxID=2895559 RepID=UPI001E461653|nr:low temperature requirement protein A [Subtercola endophyticus]UFS59438.1 low temperature requirement protein A [Subtercola endophyticus]